MGELTEIEQEILAYLKEYQRRLAERENNVDKEKAKLKTAITDNVARAKEHLVTLKDNGAAPLELENKQHDYLEALLRQKMIELFEWPDIWFDKMTPSQKLHAWAEIGKHQALTEATSGSKKRGPKNKKITKANKIRLEIRNLKGLVANRRPDLCRPTTDEIYDLLFDKCEHEAAVKWFKGDILNCHHVGRQHFANQVSSKWTIPEIRPNSEK